uniref:Alpha-ribazole phosphatase n=1 Tax=Candidatus Kentrum sp. TC TaxID=2126339 RepID=A0A450YD23_9GAMM|nr:MAG: alpha-ribazole phosphatase [Candidatus Kentron sp. TC]
MIPIGSFDDPERPRRKSGQLPIGNRCHITCTARKLTHSLRYHFVSEETFFYWDHLGDFSNRDGEDIPSQIHVLEHADAREHPLKQLIFIRHCEASPPGRYIGRTDPSLTETGAAHAHELGRYLLRLTKTSAEQSLPILSSPARRALETARLASEGIPSVIRGDADLWEIDFGRWENLRFDEIVKADPELVDEWVKDEMDFCFPAGECVEAFRERVERVGSRMRDCREEMLVVVTHGGVIRFLICYFLGLSPQSHRVFEVNPGSITRVRLYDGGAVLAGLNDFDF